MSQGARLTRSGGPVRHFAGGTFDLSAPRVVLWKMDTRPGRGGTQDVEVMPVSEHEAVVARLADWIETNCEGVQVYRDTGLVVS